MVRPTRAPHTHTQSHPHRIHSTTHRRRHAPRENRRPSSPRAAWAALPPSSPSSPPLRFGRASSLPRRARSPRCLAAAALPPRFLPAARLLPQPAAMVSSCSQISRCLPQKWRTFREEKDCIMLYVLMNMEEVVDFMSQFHDEMWSGRNGPTPTQWYTLLKEGAPPLNKSFVNWFHEKGADPNVEMTDELRCVSQGFNRRVHTHEKYDVNGYRFHTEFHQKNRPNAKTINTGVYTRGADDLDYYGRLQKVYELTFNNANIELKLFVFKCHWFDPHGGMRSTPSIGLVEVRPTTTYSGSDVYVVAHQTKQVYYLSYPCQNEELMGWEVVFQVSPHGKLPIPSEDDYNNIDPVTYEGIFYQEEEQFGALQIDIGLQDLHNDVQMRGETVVDLKDIAMLTKRHANKDNIVETQPEPNADHEYSYDTDFDSEAENPMPRDESGDECGSQGRVLPDGVEDPLFPPGVTKTQTEDGEDEGEDELEDEGEDELEDEGEDELEDEGGMHSSF
ncbi:hypothetical protein QYE76_063824 [Lolium multiflorum]|uniref:DUF4216 domain-containing protein n=1 Tax=Lolium multiflorum TaxID=4521 RepID=A0AAD8S5P4_LOLMU|nr:hypothetical protein QYE76_063824 [Lolium multiflorum]